MGAGIAVLNLVRCHQRTACIHAFACIDNTQPACQNLFINENWSRFAKSTLQAPQAQNARVHEQAHSY